MRNTKEEGCTTAQHVTKKRKSKASLGLPNSYLLARLIVHSAFFGFLVGGRLGLVGLVCLGCR